MKAYVEIDLPEYYDLNNETVELLRVTVSNGAIADTFRPHAILKEKPKNGWIPVSERLPEVMEKEFDTLLANGRKRVISFSNSVYVTLKLKKSGKYVVKEAILMDNEWRFHFSPDEDMNSLSDYGEVIAWMPLPKPYKGGDTE